MMITRPSIRHNGHSHSSGGGVTAQAVPKSSFSKECLHDHQGGRNRQLKPKCEAKRLGTISCFRLASFREWNKHGPN